MKQRCSFAKVNGIDTSPVKAEKFDAFGIVFRDEKMQRMFVERIPPSDEVRLRIEQLQGSGVVLNGSIDKLNKIIIVGESHKTESLLFNCNIYNALSEFKSQSG